MPSSFRGRARGPTGKFIKTHFTDIPPAKTKQAPRAGGGYVIMRTSNLQNAAKSVEDFRRVTTASIRESEDRASAIQARLQAAALGAYNRAATGRFARSIRASVRHFSSGQSEGSAIVVTAFNYRETRFLTNIGGSGQFKEFPVQPYRIFAKGAEGLDNLANTLGKVTKASTKAGIRIAKGEATSRLKVPRPGRFFTAARKPGRGGGESRIINDVLGTADVGDSPSAFFFYPLWVDHPGFPRDVISEVALDEGALYQEEVLRAVGEGMEEWGRRNAELTTKQMVVSRVIPLPGLNVIKAADSDLIAFARGLRPKTPYVPILSTIVGQSPKGPRGFTLRRPIGQ